MRYNKQELISLASQTSQNFDREGVMVMKEKLDGFFRRTEGCAMRWFRLRGNLLFYLKGAEPWCEPVGVIILGNHNIKTHNQDENGYWPFHIVWENGVCYRLATFHESERTLWIKALQMAPYDFISSQIVDLKEKLNRMRPVVDVTCYRAQKSISIDMNEIPLCELALSCDNLLCDAYGKPPSPLVVIYICFSKELCVKYGSTEVIQSCSNPCFSKTILFRGNDGLSNNNIVRIVVYDVKECVSETVVPIGYTTLQFSTLQESQKLRVAIKTRGDKTVGFITMNGWSLEPACTGNSPCHTNDKNCLEIPQKVQCHRRSQSLPPRLGLKLKFPSYGSLLKQNFVNSHQVTYRFHSGLGGDINVHEIMAESKLCYQIPLHLLDVYIHRERQLLDELLSVGTISGHWQNKQLDLATIHVSLLKHYSHLKRCLQQAEHAYFKASCKKDDSSLEFAPVNLHLQRMWVHNDTLNKTGFHDIITVGAFAAHSHKSERTGGLIRLVQQVKDMNTLNSVAENRIQAEYDNVVALRMLRDEIVLDLDRIIVLIQAKQCIEVQHICEVIKKKTKSLLSLWEPGVIEESLAIIGWPRNNVDGKECQTLPTIMQLTDQVSMFDTNLDYDTYEASSSSSSKETSPTVECTSLSSSVPNVSQNKFSKAQDIKNLIETSDLHFHNDYFNSEERNKLNHSFRSVRSPVKSKFSDISCLSFDSNRPRHGSLRHDSKSSTTSEHVSYRCLMESFTGADKKKGNIKNDVSPLPDMGQVDSSTREKYLAYLKSVSKGIEDSLDNIINGINKTLCSSKGDLEEQLEELRGMSEEFKTKAEQLIHWSRISHASLRLRYESPLWARDRAALQTRRDTCFSQALATLTSGLLCWFNSVPSDIVFKLLSSDLGPLCGFEGLLSLYSTEKAMWGDMVVAIEDLQTVLFTLTKASSSMSMPQLNGTRGCLTVNIPVSESLYTRFSKTEHLSFTVTAVFFNIGINCKASLAEALGETTPQYHSNNDNLDRLNKYYHKYNKIFPANYMAATRASSRVKPLEEVMENLKIAVHKKVPKNVDVLHLAALATRLMNGIRFTSCKSAKDRTGMSVTLEQCSILSSEYHLAEHEMTKALNIMRSEGCRRENTYKNIGVKKYAFTKKQVKALPEKYQPPAGTYGSSQT
ncbi:inositol polyphosphate-4-phosphatase type I A-like [Leptidea sinapis]|uniref:inositol polyphosphate-4-phosphatase type I A-like n=1 Tax=Leptidea sinapis TaxID=189913 RepID=UPI0021433CF1|nr:inositol polyphosphate-4-phosphatase type I A-like [Leptidea sinapis]